MINVGAVSFGRLLCRRREYTEREGSVAPFQRTDSGAASFSIPGEDQHVHGYFRAGRKWRNRRMIGVISGLPSARVPIERIVFGSHAPYFPVEQPS